MIEEDLNKEWKQHFPTYDFKHRDIALEEYKTASKALESEERVFLNASNVVVLATAGLGSLAVGSLNSLFKIIPSVPPYIIITMLIILTSTFAWISLRYFADRQKYIVFAARKVIVLRRMLGLNYGNLQMVLPNWRIEGADEPFAIKLFPGWNTYVAYPLYTITTITAAVLFLLLASLADKLLILELTKGIPIWIVSAIISILWSSLLAYIYRKALLDTHERVRLLIGLNVAKLLKLKVINNFEYIVYRANLARYEFRRLNVKLSTLKKALVFIEDRSFYTHGGVSLKALLRAALGLIKVKRRSGGSTITQQISRTLFIIDLHKTIRRKIIEIIFATWFNQVFSKNDQLEIYLASARFERGIYGALEAMDYFWGEKVQDPSMAQAFFLIERVSNIHSRLLSNKIIETVKAAHDAKILNSYDIKELIDIYRNAIDKKKVKGSREEIESIQLAFN